MTLVDRRFTVVQREQEMLAEPAPAREQRMAEFEEDGFGRESVGSCSTSSRKRMRSARIPAQNSRQGSGT